MKIAVLVSGNGSNLQALLDSEVRPHVSLVISNRGGVKALERARKAECNTRVILRSEYADRESFDQALAEYLREQGIELVVLAGWMHILGDRYLATAPRTINLHPALPGCYPGLNAIQRAWKDGIEKSGCMVHEVIKEVDAGAVLGVEEVALSSCETLEEFESLMHRAEHRLLVRTVAEIVRVEDPSPLGLNR